MKKNKKLKSQFKKLLNQQIHRAIRENPDVKNTKEEADIPEEHNDEDESIQSSFAWKDISKTAIISILIIGSMSILSFLLNKYGLFGKATDLILKLIGAK